MLKMPPDVIVTLIQTFVERIYITDKNDERHCHHIKVARKKDYDDFFPGNRLHRKHTENRKPELSHPFCLCVIQMSVANTTWY